MRAIVAGTILLLSAQALAQGGNAQLSYDAIMKAPVGSWAEYVTTMKGRPDQMKVRFALVEKTAKTFALEMDGQTPMGPMLMRMDYVAAGEGVWKIAKLRMQQGASAPAEVPIPPNAPPLKKGETVGEPVGTSSVKTPAGTFDAKQYRKKIEQGPVKMTVDLWMSDKVLPVGLVKQSSEDTGFVMMLAATGNGATSKMAVGEAKPANKPAAAPAPAKPAK